MSETKETKGEVWSKAPATHVNPPALEIERKYSDGTTRQFYTLPEWLIDRILADHTARHQLAAKADRYEAALRDILANAWEGALYHIAKNALEPPA